MFISRKALYISDKFQSKLKTQCTIIVFLYEVVNVVFLNASFFPTSISNDDGKY